MLINQRVSSSQGQGQIAVYSMLGTWRIEMFASSLLAPIEVLVEVVSITSSSTTQQTNMCLGSDAIVMGTVLEQSFDIDDLPRTGYLN
jgi:hypothetical protein